MPIFYSAILLTLVNLLLRAVGTSFQVYLSAAIGPAGIGLLQLTMSVGSLAMIAGMGGIRTATMYLTAEELAQKRPQNVRWVLSGCFTYSLIFCGTVSLLLQRFAPWIAQHWIGDVRTAASLRLHAAFLPTTCFCGVMTGYFTAANRIGTLAAVEVAEQAVFMVVTLTLLGIFGTEDASRACQCVILGSALGGCLTLVCLVILRLREPSPPGSRIPIAKRLCHTALPLALGDDLRSGISTLENLMVPRRLSLHAAVTDPLAVFGTISGMVFPLMMFPACILYALAELLIPELARCAASGQQKRISYLVRRNLKVAMLYGLVFSGMLFLAAPWLCETLYHSAEAGAQLRLYALLIPMLYCDAITDAMTKGLGQQTVCVRYNILTSALDVLFLYLLLPKYGTTGYFFSFFLTHLLNFILSLRRLLKITAESLPLRIPLLAVGGSATACFLCAHAGSDLIGGIFYPVVLLCLLILLGVVGGEDLQWLRGLIRQKRPKAAP